MENPFSLKGKTIFVTGASSGIGKATAILCAEMGATVIVSGRNAARLDDTLAQMPDGGHQKYVCDLTDTAALPKVAENIPNLDGVVHCAGIGQRILCKQLTEQDIDTVMDTNFKAPVLLQTELLKQKKINKSASIVFVGSIAAESPSIGNAIYSASKGALISYAQCLGKELAGRQIRVNVISPAMVKTNLIYADGISEEQLAEDEKRYPLKRYGNPEDIANLAVYLLSDAASWMTISNVKITGGVINLS